MYERDFKEYMGNFHRFRDCVERWIGTDDVKILIENTDGFKDTWESLAEHETPKWFKEAKFGIFIHWGIYSVPAFGNEWYSRNMYIQGTPEFEHHMKTFGPQNKFGYKDFIPMFKAENFDPKIDRIYINGDGATWIRIKIAFIVGYP